MCTGAAIMLTNEYLRPEYLPPVSGSFDVNKSPLALLAKTCSNIGVETPSIKSLTTSSSSSSNSSNSSSSASSINSIEHRRSTPKSKSTSAESNPNEMSKLNFKPYELSHNSHNNNNNNHHHNNNNKSNNGKLSDKDKMRSSPGKNTPVSSASGNHQNHHSKAQMSSPPGAQLSNSDSHKQSHQHQSNGINSSAPLSYTSLGLPDMHKDSLAAFYKAYGFMSPNCCPTSTSSPYAGLMPPPITLDKTGAYPSIYPPSASATAAATLAVYNYARLKGNMGMMPGASNPMCRDPYCGGACGQFGSMHANSHAALMAASSAGMAYREPNSAANQPVPGTNCTPATCPNGCSQCEHHRYLAAITAAAYGNSFPGLNSAAYPQSMSASYASSLAAAAALHHRTAASAAGNVCNWIVGDVQCGKRFSTSEELLQHLKTHTIPLQQQHPSESSTNTPTSAPSSSSSSTPSVPTSAHHYTSSSSPRASPASHPHQGANSPLAKHSASSASPTHGHHAASANRFHPYSKPSSVVPNPLPPSAHLTNNPFAGMAYPVPTSGAPSYPSAAHPYAAALSQSAAAASMPSFASNLYYPYMTPNFFSGRIGPPVPP